MQGDLIELHATQAETLLRRLLAADDDLSDLQVLPLSLEDAFLSLNAPAHAQDRPTTTTSERREEIA
jgi:hypothetical protein